MKSIPLPYRIAGSLVVAAILLASSGCAGMVLPNWSNPGTMRQQQLRAIINDPYPDTDAGPEMEGVRPREFQRSVPEAVKLRPDFYAAPPRRVYP